MAEAAATPPPQGGVSRIQLMRDIVREGQARRIRINGRKVWVDLFTASAVVAVADALAPKNLAAYEALPWERFIEVTWRVLRAGERQSS